MLAVIKLRRGKICPQWDEKSDRCVLRIAGAIGRQIARDLDRLEREVAHDDKGCEDALASLVVEPKLGELADSSGT